MERQVIQVIQGRPAVDGAGVRLNRVLGPDNVLDFDPFLMLDAPFGELGKGTFLRTKTEGL